MSNQGDAATFFLKYLKHFENGEISSDWKLLKLTGGQFWVERNVPGHKKPHFVEFKPISRVQIYKFNDLFPLFLRGKVCASYLKNRKDTKLKFCIRNGSIAMTQAKFPFQID